MQSRLTTRASVFSLALLSLIAVSVIAAPQPYIGLIEQSSDSPMRPFSVHPFLPNVDATAIIWSGGAGGGTAWLTAANWTGGVIPTAAQIAQFDTTGTASVIGINMNGATNNGPNNQIVGAIWLSGGIARTIGNSSTSVGGTLTLNGVTVNGVDNVILRNSSSLLLTLRNQGGGTPIQVMDVALNNATNNIINIDGAGGITISSVIKNGAGNHITLGGTGTGALTLSGANTYSGGTTIDAGTLIANVDGALGTGGISLIAASVTLTLQNGATNNYIADNVDLSIVTGSIVSMNFTGTDVVGGLIVNGVAQAPGVYVAGSFAELIGTGSLTVIPEPATYAMLFIGAGLLFGVQRLRRKTS